MTNLRWYAPVTDGEFAGIIDALGRAGASCAAERPSFVHCSKHGASFTIVHDVEGGIRAYLTSDGGLGERAWDLVDPILKRSDTRTGWGPSAVGVDMACAPPGDTGNVSMFGFQKTCEECGNCDSPDWEAFRRWSIETEHLRDPNTPSPCQPPRYPEPGDSFVFPQNTCQECGNCDDPAWISFHEWSRECELDIARQIASTEHVGQTNVSASDVLAAQQMLRKLGYTGWKTSRRIHPDEDPSGADQPLDADGVLGFNTWVALRRFQSIHGLYVDGLPGSATLAALRAAVQPNDSTRVGAFFYDQDLAKFGNAFSPFVQTDSVARANLALQRPFEDRYNPRYDNQPTWAEWQGMDEAISGTIGESQGIGGYDPSQGQDPNLPGGPCGCFPTRECLERHGLCAECDGSEYVGGDPGPTCWTDPDTGVISMFPTMTAAKRAADESAKKHAVAGGFESVDKGALVATGIIAGITTLLALNHKEHWLEISAAGLGGIALAWGMSAGKLLTSR